MAHFLEENVSEVNDVVPSRGHLYLSLRNSRIAFDEMSD